MSNQVGIKERIGDIITGEFLEQAEAAIANNLADRIADAEKTLFRAEISNKPLLGFSLYLPTPVLIGSRSGEYMSASIPLTRDFLHPKFLEFIQLYDHSLPDYLVDVPPYRHNPHLKLMFGNFVVTSIGLVIRRGI